MHRYTQPPPLGQDKAAERARALKELRAAEADALNNVGWVDPAKDIVRLRIEDAMKLVERAWRNPPAARSNLLERVAKAYPPPPKPAPSPWECFCPMTKSDTLFPLTPALSPRERENRIQSLEESKRYRWPKERAT